MLTKPSYGWTDVVVFGNKIGNASYVEDVPSIVLDGLTAWFTAANTGNNYIGLNLWFEAEHYSFGLIDFDGELYSLDDFVQAGSDSPLNVRRIGGYEKGSSLLDILTVLARDAIFDIRSNIEEWKLWNTAACDDQEEAEEYKAEYLRKCDILEQLIEQAPRHGSCVPDKDACQADGVKAPASEKQVLIRDEDGIMELVLVRDYDDGFDVYLRSVYDEWRASDGEFHQDVIARLKEKYDVQVVDYKKKAGKPTASAVRMGAPYNHPVYEKHP